MTYAAGALLELPDGRIALHHRDNKPTIASPDKWAFFGGMGEDGEAPIDTVVRELNEELEADLVRDRLTLIHSKAHSHRQNHYIHIFHYPVTDELDNAVLHEGQGWGKFTPQEISTLNIVTGHLQIIDNYRKNKARGVIYLASNNQHVLLPQAGIDWNMIIGDPSADTVTISSAHRLMTNHRYTPQFTYHHHPKFIIEVYTICVTNKADSTVNLNEWVDISPETIDSVNLDFHTRAIIEHYWKSHINK